MRIVGNNPQLSRQTQGTASGAITGGKPVVVNTDGTVGVPTGGATGTAVVFDADQVYLRASAVYDTNADRIVIAYQDSGNSYYGTAIVGTVNSSDNSISFGSPVVFKSANTRMFNSSFDINASKIVIVYRDSNPGRAIVATVDPSDNSISFGSEATYDATKGNEPHIAYDVNAQKHLITYYDNDDDGRAIVGTVSGTSISFGSSAEFETEDTREPNVIYDVNAQKHLIFYYQNLSGGSDTPAKARVATISGTSVSFGTIATISTNVVDTLAGAYDVNAQKSVLVYRDQTSSTAKARVATISGTDVSFGTEAEFDDGQAISNDAVYDASLQKTVFTFKDQGNSNKGSFKSGTISGTDITFGSTIVFEEGSTAYTSVIYDPDTGKNIVAFVDAGDSNKGKAIVIKTFNPISLTSENFIGFAQDTVATGQPVTINTKGAIADNIPQIASASSSLGTAVSFESASTSRIASCFDSTNNRIVVSYVDSGSDDDGTVAVGTINASDNSISWGTPVAFNSNVKITDSQIIHDSNSNKIVVAYTDEDNSYYGTGIVGTIDTSDNSISFGSPTVYESANTNTSSRNGITFDSNSNKVVIVYTDQGNSNYGTAVVGTVSGTSISFGTPVVFESAFALHMGATFDSSNNKVVIAYRDNGNSDYGTAIVGTVSGTSISFGTAVVYESAESDWNSITFDSNSNKVVISYQDKGNSNYGTAIVGTVSGTSISFGTAVVYESASVNYTAIDFDSNLNKVIIGYEDIGNSEYGTFVIGTVSGTSISFTSPAVFYSGELSWVGVSFDSNAKRSVFTYRDADNSNNGRSVVLQPAGILEDIVPAQTYYVQTDGTLSQTADSPSVTAGTAVAGSTLIVKG